MQIVRIKDKHNTAKVWVIKRSKAGHYFVNQEISGDLIYGRFSRMSAKHLNAVLELDIKQVFTKTMKPVRLCDVAYLEVVPAVEYSTKHGHYVEAYSTAAELYEALAADWRDPVVSIMWSVYYRGRGGMANWISDHRMLCHAKEQASLYGSVVDVYCEDDAQIIDRIIFSHNRTK